MPPQTKRLLEITQPWYREQPFTQGFFADVVATSISGHDDQEIRRVASGCSIAASPSSRKCSYRERDRGRSDDVEDARQYWDDLWYPGSDDLGGIRRIAVVALFLWHQEIAFFASRPVPTTRPGM